MHQAGYVRLFADEQGESHFAEVAVPLDLIDFAPPATPLLFATLFPATSCGLVSGPPGWDGTTPHPSPRRQLMCNLRGEYEVTASDGTSRRFPAGSVLLLEDTWGKGHSTRGISAEELLLVAVTLAE